MKENDKYILMLFNLKAYSYRVFITLICCTIGNYITI